METPAPLVNGIINKALLQCNPHCSHCCIKSFTNRLYLVDSLLNYAPDFVVDWIEVGDVRQPQIWKLIRVTVIF